MSSVTSEAVPPTQWVQLCVGLETAVNVCMHVSAFINFIYVQKVRMYLDANGSLHPDASLFKDVQYYIHVQGEWRPHAHIFPDLPHA